MGRPGNYLYMVPNNYFIGHESGNKLQNSSYSGKYNTFFGYQTGLNDTVGGSNVFIGYKSGLNNTGNISSGDTLGSRNVFLGYEAGLNNTHGSDNVLLGYQAGHEVTTAGNNISIGSGAGYSNTNNSDNIFIGRNAGFYHTGNGTVNQAVNNIYIGLEAGQGDGLTTNQGSNNIYLGNQSGMKNTSGLNNVFLGNQSGMANTEGANNVMLGNQSGVNTTTGLNNVFLGNNSGFNNAGGDNNIFLGNNSGDNNVFLGNGASLKNTQGERSVTIGNRAAYWLETNNYNVIIGDSAAFGYDDGYNFTYPFANVILGQQAGFKLGTSSSYNVFMGYKSGYNINDNNTGNVLIGAWAGLKIGSSGSDLSDNNVLIGYQRGVDVEGRDNVMLGASEYSAGTRNVSYSVFIGKNAGDNETSSNKLYIDNSNTTTPLIYGDFSANTLQVNGTLSFNTGSNSVTLPTDRGTNGYVLTSSGTGGSSWNSMSSLDATTASNGLTLSGNDVQLGGTLTNNTWISASDYLMGIYLNGTGNFTIHDGSSYAFTVTDDGQNSMVGIGTYTPAQNTALHVLLSGTALTSQYTGTVATFQQNGGTGDWSRVSIIGGTSGASVLDLGDADSQGIGKIYYGHNDNHMALFTNNLERMRIDANGNVGIGTTTVPAKFNINTNCSGAAPHITLTETQANDGARIDFKNSVETDNSWTLYGRADNTTTDNYFNLYSGGTGSGNVMIIRGDGQVQFPHVYNDFVGTTRRDLYIDNTGKLGYISSSRRYKKNITSISDISWLYDLRPVNFIYKKDKTNTKEYGFIAEEVEEVNKDFVSYNKDGSVETVYYSRLITPTIKALQEEHKTNIKQAKEIQELKKQIQELKQLIQKK